MMKQQKKSPWYWVPSLYFVEGLPYVIVMTVSVTLLQRLGFTNTENAFYTSLLYLPWVIKPFWSPLVDNFRTKRKWIFWMQSLICISLFGLAFSIPFVSPLFFIMLCLWLMAFASATQDIAIDGFYMLALNKPEQAYFVGIRSTAYRLAMLFGQGPLIIFAGYLEIHTGDIPQAWSYTFYAIAVLFTLLFIYHHCFVPKASADVDRAPQKLEVLREQITDTITSFFKKEGIGIAIVFLLVFRFAEAQLAKLASPFLLDAKAAGGLALPTDDVGLVYGTAGVIALIVGGVLGGMLVAKFGLKRLIWPMVFAMNLPNLFYVFLAMFQISSLGFVAASVMVEQFGYGFGFTAYMLYMIQLSDGKYKTTHYALCTGIMALGMMLPGMISGWIQSQVGYLGFFIWVMLCTIPSFVLIPYLKLSNDFGKKA